MARAGIDIRVDSTELGVIGVIVINPSIELPAFVGFEVKNQPLFPILFVTIACGAVSGFHSLVSSGTSSKMISNEADMRPVGYGSMLVECVLGVLSLVVVPASSRCAFRLWPSRAWTPWPASAA